MRQRYVLLLIIALLLLMGCEHKDLYVPEYSLRRVRVDFDFTDVKCQPAEMRVFFCRVQDNGSYGAITRADLPASGGYIDLLPGNYRVVAYNVDTENVLEQQGESLDDFQLTTRSYMVEEISLADFRQQREASQAEGTSSSSASHNVQRRNRSLFGAHVPVNQEEDWYMLYDAPEWTCCCPSVDYHLAAAVKKTGTSLLSESSVDRLVLHAVSAVRTIEIEVKGIQGVKWADLVMGTLSGVASSVRITDGHPSSQEGMVSFSLRVDKERGVLESSFFVWGFYPEDRMDVRQCLNIYLWANTGNYYMSKDVSDLLQQAEKDGALSVVINMESDLNLMDAAQGNSGFRPSLGGWEEEGYSLPLW